MVYFFDQVKQQQFFSSKEIKGTGYLAFRDLFYFAQSIGSKLNKVLDVGCGNGRSTRFIEQWSNQVYGCDLVADILPDDKKYFKTDLLNIPYHYAPYDTIFSIFTLFHIENETELRQFAQKLVISLNENGKVILVIGSPFLFTQPYSTVKPLQDYSISQLKSGKIVNMCVNGVELQDVVWLYQDVIELFKSNGLYFIGMHQPLGYTTDQINYTNEYHCPPYQLVGFIKK